jgi:hypothetical protein
VQSSYCHAFIKNNLNRDAQVKKTIAEIQLITEAAQKYQLDNSTWADEAIAGNSP